MRNLKAVVLSCLLLGVSVSGFAAEMKCCAKKMACAEKSCCKHADHVDAAANDGKIDLKKTATNNVDASKADVKMCAESDCCCCKDKTDAPAMDHSTMPMMSHGDMPMMNHADMPYH